MKEPLAGSEAGKKGLRAAEFMASGGRRESNMLDCGDSYVDPSTG